MLYFFSSLIIGAVLNIFFLQPATGVGIYPEFHCDINSIKQIEKSHIFSSDNLPDFFINNNDQVHLLKGDGSILFSTEIKDSLLAFSGNGQYYVKYQRVGEDLEFYNLKGERFWKQKSREYPYLSNNGKLIFLMNGDHSRIRIVDYNGNLIGDKEITGRMCTIVSFAEKSDYGCLGFVDGSYYIINKMGKIIFSSRVPSGKMVKSISVSNNGTFASIHYGNTEKDFIRLINITEKEHHDVKLKNVHSTRTSIYISDQGYATIIDVNKILHISKSGEIDYSIKIPPKRMGFSSISSINGLYSVSYTTKKGSTKLIIFKKDGTILFSREYPGESFLQSSLKGSLIFLRGSDNLYCYSFHNISSE